jgi:hypothetical protein
MNDKKRICIILEETDEEGLASGCMSVRYPPEADGKLYKSVQLFEDGDSIIQGMQTICDFLKTWGDLAGLCWYEESKDFMMSVFIDGAGLLEGHGETPQAAIADWVSQHGGWMPKSADSK